MKCFKWWFVSPQGLPHAPSWTSWNNWRPPVLLIVVNLSLFLNNLFCLPEFSTVIYSRILIIQLLSTRWPGYESDGSSPRPTIRDQLSQLSGDTYGEFSLPLGKKLKASMNNLTISQKRNIRRQAYLDEVSQRNDSVFFATIGAFVILPPLIILAVAVLTGYVQLLPWV